MKTNLFVALACLIMGMSIPCLSAADKAAPKEKTRVVTAKGFGITASKAERAALRAAVEQVVGGIIDAKTLIRNEKVVKDEILDYSNSFVEKYSIIDRGTDSIFTTITIRATVQQRKVIERLEKFKVYIGPVTIIDPLSPGGGAALLKKTLKDLDLPDSLLKVQAVNPKPDILNTTENEPRVVKLEWVFQIQFDQDKYRKVVLPKLKQVLGGIDIATEKIKFPLHHNVPANNAVLFGKDGVYEYLFGVPGKAEFAPRLPRAGKDPRGLEIQGKKPVAGGVPVFLLEDLVPQTGLQTYSVYWVDLESAKVLGDYLAAQTALQLDLSGPDKKTLFSETIHFRGHIGPVLGRGATQPAAMGEGVIMPVPIGTAQRQAQVLCPTFIYPGQSEFIDESALLGINGRRFSLVPTGGGLVNTISIMPLMHLRMNVDPRGRQPGLRGVTKVAQYSWQPIIPLAIIKDVVEISCSFVNAGQQ